MLKCGKGRFLSSSRLPDSPPTLYFLRHFIHQGPCLRGIPAQIVDDLPVVNVGEHFCLIAGWRTASLRRALMQVWQVCWPGISYYGISLMSSSLLISCCVSSGNVFFFRRFLLARNASQVYITLLNRSSNGGWFNVCHRRRSCFPLRCWFYRITV